MRQTTLPPLVLAWLLLAWLGWLLLPWHALPASASWLGWMAGGDPAGPTGPALLQGLLGGRSWLLWLLPGLLLATIGALRPPGRGAGTLLLTGALLGLVAGIVQGFAIRHDGLRWDRLLPLVGEGAVQHGIGSGAVLTLSSLLLLLAEGIARRGGFRGDRLVAGGVVVIVALVALFVFLPVAQALFAACFDDQGNLAPLLLVERLASRDIWGLDCLGGGLRCGVAWNSLLLALLAAAGSTLLGLALALVAVRSGFRYKGALRSLAILPIITPPFVVGIVIIVLFGRTGIVTAWLFEVFGIPRSRWVYGLPGVLLAQLLSQTPLAFLMLVGALEAIAPSLEEAAQTLRASPGRIFRTVTWPLLRPGLAGAFLLGFVESLADFGNPLVLGGNFEVLSTKIFFAVVGAQHDPGRAAGLAAVLLAFTLGAFWLQSRWLGRRTYVTVTGKGDGGLPLPLPKGLARLCGWVAGIWVGFTLLVYALILLGGFVNDIGRFDLGFTWRHLLTGFRIEWTEFGLLLSGSAWDSLLTTLEVALIAAPLTAGIGLLTAYLLARQTFPGRGAFEFGTMLSFAIPGTVIGVSYIVAFNVPPIEITGTGLILVLCFVFRNMPVGVRAGLAALSQLDRSLDEASTTLGADTATTLRRVVLPLLRPAVIATLVFSFVHAMTSVSAIIFLVSARYNMATTYIVGRVEVGEYALAIAYSTVLILVMLLAIGLIQLLVGRSRLGRRSAGAAPAPLMVGAGG